jgi:hypothetical protein
MKRFRTSLAGLMAAVLFLAVGLASLLNPTPFAASVLFMVMVTLLSAAVLRALASRGRVRAAWAGVAIFGWVYFGLVFGPLENGNATTIPSLPTMIIYEHILNIRLIPKAKEDFPKVRFKNSKQAETVFDKASLAGTPRVLVDVMDLKRIVHSIGAILFALMGGWLGKVFYDRAARTRSETSIDGRS